MTWLLLTIPAWPWPSFPWCIDVPWPLSFMPVLEPHMFVFKIYLLVFIVIISCDGISLCCPGWSAVVRSQLPATSTSRIQVILMPQPHE